MTLDKLTSVLHQGGEHLGDLVWWTLSEARIDRPSLEKIWAGSQLAPDSLPDAPTAEKALKAAVREAAIGQSDRLIRLGKEDEAEVVFAVVRETKHLDGSITYQQETRIILDRKAESVSSDVAGHDLAAVVATRFAELRATHTPDDVRRAMMKTLDGCAAVTLRDHGGVYWIPAPHADMTGRRPPSLRRTWTSTGPSGSASRSHRATADAGGGDRPRRPRSTASSRSSSARSITRSSAGSSRRTPSRR